MARKAHPSFTAGVLNGKVYIDLASFTDGLRARADETDRMRLPAVATWHRRMADELDAAAIGWISSETPPPMPPPALLELVVLPAVLHRLGLPPWGFTELRGIVPAPGSSEDAVVTVVRLRAEGVSPWAQPPPQTPDEP